MKGRSRFPAAIVLLGLPMMLSSMPAPAVAQAANTTQREATRERLRAFLATAGARNDVNIAFHQSDKNPWNFVGVANGLTNSDSFEVIVQVSDNNTLAVVVYPHYRGNYINLTRASDSIGLARKLLNLNDHNFFYWGADDTSDVFACYNFTLESGFPDQSLLVALISIRAQDKFVGELRPLIDGTAAK